MEKKQNFTSNAKPVAQSCFNDQLGHNLPPECTEPSTGIGEVSRAWVIKYCRPSCFCDSSADDREDQVRPFLRAFFVPEKRQPNLFLSKQSVLFRRDMMSVHDTAAVVDEQRLTTDEKNVL